MISVNNNNECVSLHKGIKLPEDDNVNHPNHYTSNPSGIECIEIARHMDFNLGNVLKYIWRHGKKRSETNPDELSNAIEDLEKAAWYLNDEIRMLKEVKEKMKRNKLYEDT